jgi:haloalkane dehalogenase
VSSDDGLSAGRLAYREAMPAEDAGRPPVLAVHGFPETSHMWRHLLPAVAAAGRRAIAPDLLGYGDSEPDPPATWQRHVEALGEFADALELERVVLVVHDWGGLIGLRWACENPERVAGLLISDSGFFPDGRWHGMAEGLRTEGQGEQMVEALDRAALGAVLSASNPGFDEATVDEYFKAFSTPQRRAGVLEMYRSGDFTELERYDGALAGLGVPTLLIWGEDDPFSPVAGAHRFQREIPDARLEVIAGSGHFVWADAPERAVELAVGWLAELP